MKWIIGILLLISVNNLLGQELNQELKIFETVISKDWYAKVSGVDKVWRMEVILEGAAVRKIANNSNGNSSETIFYWDIQNKEIAFFKIGSNTNITRGTVIKENDVFIFQGLLSKRDFETDFKNTLEIISDTVVIDTWYGKMNQGHNITYKAQL